MGKRKPLSPECVARIVSRYQSGETIKDIENSEHVYHQRIRYILSRHHITIRSSKTPHDFTLAEREEMVSLYATTGLNKLASRYHVGQREIIQVLEKEGVVLRKPNEAPNMLSWKSIAAALKTRWSLMTGFPFAACVGAVMCFVSAPLIAA